MGNLAIRAMGLGKQYRLGTSRSYGTLRGSLTALARRPFRARRAAVSAWNAENLQSERRDLIWAVREVSFEIRHGEVVGVIGRNGAGKSTLLKILSRITEPTEGCAEIHGRVGSLLEVGTGFHPELTGRENVYLNGAIMGMRRREIDRRFDEIVAFAEVERFVDTPVKRYSSGMYVRLAFAVAAHLEPEVLVVDEVLAVGDIAFQRKCLGKLGDVSRQGRTVLLVSHNVVAVEHLCDRALLLDQGRLVMDGESGAVVREYLTRSASPAAAHDLALARMRRGSGEVRFGAIECLPLSGPVMRSGDGLIVRLRYQCSTRVQRPNFSLAITTPEGVLLFAVRTSDLNLEIPEIDGAGSIELEIARLSLMPRRYLVDVAVGDDVNPHRYDHIIGAAELEIEPADVYGSGKLWGAAWSYVFFDCKWRLGG